MRHAVFARAAGLVMIASAALLVSSCGHHDDAANASNASGGGNSGSDDFVVNGAELGDNDMDGNAAQVDAANSTTVAGRNDSSALGNGPL